MIFFSWSRICHPKKEGGFNVKEALAWNKSLMCKWLVKLDLVRGIWAKWVTAYYVKYNDWWYITPKITNSWAWKGLIKIKDLILNSSGDRDQAIALLDSWCKDGKLIVSRAYEFFRSKGSIINWDSTIWNPYVIPSHAIIASLAIQNSLATGDKILEKGFNGPNRCILCKQDGESVSHLFFSCSFSKKIWMHLKSWSRFSAQSNNLHNALWILRRHYKLRSWRNDWIKVTTMAVVYFI